MEPNRQLRRTKLPILRMVKDPVRSHWTRRVFKEIHDAVEEMEMVSVIRGCRLHSQKNTLRKLFPMMPTMKVK